jgi:hypothetical protein
MSDSPFNHFQPFIHHGETLEACCFVTRVLPDLIAFIDALN